MNCYVGKVAISVQCRCSHCHNFDNSQAACFISLASQFYSEGASEINLREPHTVLFRGFIKFLCRRSVEFYNPTFLAFLVRESKKRRRKQLGKLMAKSCSQLLNLPGAWPLINPLLIP